MDNPYAVVGEAMVNWGLKGLTGRTRLITGILMITLGFAGGFAVEVFGLIWLRNNDYTLLFWLFGCSAAYQALCFVAVIIDMFPTIKKELSRA